MLLRILVYLPCFYLLPPVPAPWDRGEHGGTVGPHRGAHGAAAWGRGPRSTLRYVAPVRIHALVLHSEATCVCSFMNTR